MSKKIVVLDAGHGGSDPGAVNGIRFEKDDALRMVKQVDILLKKQGVETYLTREDDRKVELYSRPTFSNTKKADAFVSIHRNWFTKGSANGVEIWVHPNASAVDTTLATTVIEQVLAVGVQSNRGIKYGKYAVLTAKAPAIMIELGFISNKEDNRLFDVYFDDYAEAITRGICNFLGVEYNAEKPKQLYRVQIGAFETEDTARRFLAYLKEYKEIEAFLVMPSSERVEIE